MFKPGFGVQNPLLKLCSSAVNSQRLFCSQKSFWYTNTCMGQFKIDGLKSFSMVSSVLKTVLKHSHFYLWKNDRLYHTIYLSTIPHIPIYLQFQIYISIYNSIYIYLSHNLSTFLAIELPIYIYHA